ncbi:MAG: tRNA (adenosine(37)-N6)-threonylcarbamoyltransferase complex dimerization subunit type 1 TsaB [Candidatus Krumholzibacteriia bacterium]
MLTLAMDAATRRGRFAVAEDGRLLLDHPHDMGSNFADALVPVAMAACAAAERRLADVRAVAVTQGPGSFTGVRIAVATAKTLAWTLGARLVAVPTTAAMAAALLEDHPAAQLAVPVLDARRGELFAAVYGRDGGGWVQEIVPPAPLAPDAWWDLLRDRLQDVEAPVYGGDGVPLLLTPGGRLRDELSGRGEPVQRLWSSTHPATARALAVAASRADAGLPGISPFALVPLYLRGSDAEVNRRVDLTPRAPSDRFVSHRAGDLAVGEEEP